MPLQTGAFGSTFVPNFAPEQSIVPDLGGLINLRIDPTWDQYTEWVLAANPIGAQLNLTFMDLEGGITEDSKPNYAATDIIGRAEGFRTYMGTSNREISLIFQFVAQGIGSNDYYNALLNEVQGPSRWLDSLKYPFVDSQGISHAPPPCILTVGQLLLLPVIVEAATIKWMNGWDPNTMLPLASEVSCTFVAVHPSLGNYQYTGPTRFAGFTAEPDITAAQGQIANNSNGGPGGTPGFA